MLLLVGGVLIALAMSSSESLDSELLLASDPPKILVLTTGFFLLYLIVATQDIAVDGWALTLLRYVVGPVSCVQGLCGRDSISSLLL